MRNTVNFVLLVFILLITGCSQSRVGEMQFPEGQVQHVVRAGDIQWNDCPPHLPDLCEVTVLAGDPQSADMFTVRFRLSEGFLMPPHTHPKDERVTVIEGLVSVAFGPEGSRENAKQFGPGDYYVNARNAIHTVWADSNSIVQITGIGPWEAHFIEQ
jgi:quercetin dioxygenase-like cupin family protein